MAEATLPASALMSPVYFRTNVLVSASWDVTPAAVSGCRRNSRQTMLTSCPSAWVTQ
jgi:hypothetical protein